jgi:hypothetical protein
VLYREYIGGNESITESLKRLAELDEFLGENDEEISFEDTEEGWQPTSLAA